MTSIEKRYQSVEVAYAGSYVGFCVENVTQENVKRGYFCGDLFDNPPAEAEFFSARILVPPPNQNTIYVVFSPHFSRF